MICLPRGTRARALARWQPGLAWPRSASRSQSPRQSRSPGPRVSEVDVSIYKSDRLPGSRRGVRLVDTTPMPSTKLMEAVERVGCRPAIPRRHPTKSPPGVPRRLLARAEDQARFQETWCGAPLAGSYSPLPRTANVKANRRISNRIKIPNAIRSRTSPPLEYGLSRHSNPIRKARPTGWTRVRPRVMYNVAMCSTLSPEAHEDRLGLRAEFQGRGCPWPLISP